MTRLLGGRSPTSQLLACCLLLARVAAANHCAPPELGEPTGHGVRLAVGALVGSFSTERYTGELQGGAFSVEWAHPWIRLRAAQPVYRVTRNGPAAAGIGDLALDVWPTVYRDDSLSAGLRVSATAPLGDHDADLGMGHAMLSLGLWLNAALTDSWRLHAELGFARALVDSLGEHHHGPAPLVDPMNGSEVVSAVSVSYTLGRFTLRSTLGGALPAGVDDGEARGSLSLGGAVRLGLVELGVDGAFPIVGDPFEARLSVQVAVSL